MKVNVIDRITVKRGLAAEVKDMVTNQGFYRPDRQSRSDQFDRLNDLKDSILEIYGIEDNDLMVVDAADYVIEDDEEITYGKFDEEKSEIVINRMSVITFLTCMRGFLYTKGVGTQLNVKHVDQLAWACRVFKLACPNSFKKSVKAGNVVGFEWDDENDVAVMNLTETVAEML